MRHTFKRRFRQSLSSSSHVTRSLLIGIASAATAFATQFIFGHLLDDASLTLLIAAVAFSCWLGDWRAGIYSSVAGLLAAALLLPPVFSLTVDSAADVAMLGAFAFTCFCVCFVAYVSDRRASRLRSVEKRTEMSEGWIESAQREVALWTWELDLENFLLKWRNPYGEIISQEFRSYETWLSAVHPGDRDKFAENIQRSKASGVFHAKYHAYTTRGLHRLASRGIVLQENENAPKVLVGITVDLDCEQAPTPASRRDGIDGSQLILALIEVNDLLAQVEEAGSSTPALAEARDRIAQLLIRENAPSLTD